MPLAAAWLSTACQFDRPVPRSSLPAIDPPFGANITDAEVARFEPGRDYFPDKVAFRLSTQLSVTYHGHYKRVRLVTNAVGEEFSFVFLQRGTPVPDLGPDDVLVPVPLERFSLAT